MHLASIHIENFKAISFLELSDLSRFVLVAGPNGVGKSCLLDAIRMLKSHLGGYVPNEMDFLYGEFQLDAAEPRRLRPLFRDIDKPISIEATFTLASDEEEYIRLNAASILSEHFWRQAIGRQSGDNIAMYTQRLLVASTNSTMVQQVEARVSQHKDELINSLAAGIWHGRLEVQYGGFPASDGDFLLHVLFGLYSPEHIGVIDYHSANRNYAREAIGGFSLNLANGPSFGASGESSLYNTSGKYQNIKAEMVDAYIRDLIRRDVGLEVSDQTAGLAASLTDLFATFFPDKSFNGIRVDGNGVPQFPVTVPGGEHDLNELSSGEKEILFGYLRLRTTTPRNSIILLDEPELHLNPALLSGLPAFYNKHIGEARNNQLILVTHSDAILRPVVGSAEYMLVHLSPPGDGVEERTNQGSLVSGSDEFERTVISLVGDVATYKPDAKYLLVEGGDNTGIDAVGFDRTMISTLFPEFAKRINILGAGERSKVERLLDLLQDPALQQEFGHRVFAIVDHDSFGTTELMPIQNYSRWDRYHIENYLIEERFIAKAVAHITLEDVSPSAVGADLESAASRLVDELAFEATRVQVNREVVSCINLGRKAGSGEPVETLVTTLGSSMARLSGVLETLDDTGIRSKFQEHRARYESFLAKGTWRLSFPGRSILRRYVRERFGGRVAYEYFRNLIITDMAQAGYQPEGMRSELAKVDPGAFTAPAHVGSSVKSGGAATG